MFIINFCLNMFRASLCPSSGEQMPSYCIWCIVLALLDVVGSGCGALKDMLRQKLIINIHCCILLVFSLHTILCIFWVSDVYKLCSAEISVRCPSSREV